MTTVSYPFYPKPDGTWMNAEFLSSYLDRGRVINITPVSRSTLELESIP